MDTTYRSLAELILPEGILDYFELTDVTKEVKGFHIYLAEKNLPPAEYKHELLHSKGFYPEVQVSDFPIRGKKVHLCIKRRRWEVQSSGAIVSRDWTLVHKGSKMTTEFGLFLKGVFGQQAS